ncbi:hypothetical protein Plhal304r1_c016g0060171 [Plasmopara halstedii]
MTGGIASKEASAPTAHTELIVLVKRLQKKCTKQSTLLSSRPNSPGEPHSAAQTKDSATRLKLQCFPFILINPRYRQY